MNEGATILLPVDFSSHSRAAAIRACHLAAGLGMTVRMIHALHLPPVAREAAVPSDFWLGLRRSEAARL